MEKLCEVEYGSQNPTSGIDETHNIVTNVHRTIADLTVLPAARNIPKSNVTNVSAMVMGPRIAEAANGTYPMALETPASHANDKK